MNILLWCRTKLCIFHPALCKNFNGQFTGVARNNLCDDHLSPLESTPSNQSKIFEAFISALTEPPHSTSPHVIRPFVLQLVLHVCYANRIARGALHLLNL